MASDDGYELTPEEIELYFQATKRRIKAVERKAILRLEKMRNGNDTAGFWRAVRQDPAWQEVLFILLITFDWRAITKKHDGLLLR